MGGYWSSHFNDPFDRPTQVSALSHRPLALPFPFAACASRGGEELLQVFVTEPYLELHNGPGRGYPVAQVVARGDPSTSSSAAPTGSGCAPQRGVEGWAASSDMLNTELADGTPFTFNLGDRAGYTSHDWEIGIWPATTAAPRSFRPLPLALPSRQLAVESSPRSSSATPRMATCSTSA